METAHYGTARRIGTSLAEAKRLTARLAYNHIDISGRERLDAELLALGATCILTSHDCGFIQAVGIRFLLIAEGWIREIAVFQTRQVDSGSHWQNAEWRLWAGSWG